MDFRGGGCGMLLAFPLVKFKRAGGIDVSRCIYKHSSYAVFLG
jgi:hypothetical protein